MLSKEQIKENKFKLFYFLSSNNPNEISEKNLKSELLNTNEEINYLLKKKKSKEFMMIVLYFNRNKIHNILYESEEIIKLSSDLIHKKSSFFFYLFLLLKENEEEIDYEYSLDFIEDINKELDNTFIIKNIVISKLVSALIFNYRGLDRSDKDEEENELIKIEKEISNKIKSDLIKLKEDFGLNFDEKTIENNKIDKIYIDIVRMLIENNIIDDYKKSENFLKEMDFENIYLTKTMFNELKKILEKDIVNKYKISEKKDLLDGKKINFYYLLFKYIIKSPLYIYNIPFLYQVKKQIIKILKEHSFDDLNYDLKYKLNTIIPLITDSQYYFIKKEVDINSSISAQSSSTQYNSRLRNTLTTSFIQSDMKEFKLLQLKKNWKVEDSITYIREMSNGYLVFGLKNDKLVIYEQNLDSSFQVKINDNLPKIYLQNLIEASSSIADSRGKAIRVLICSKESLFMRYLKVNDEDRNNIKYDIPCSGCYEKIKNDKIEYVVIGKKGLYHFEDFPSQNINEDYYKIIQGKQNYKGSIKINENILAITSNSVLMEGEDIILFYDMNEKKIINYYKGCSFVNGVNGLITIDLYEDNKTVLLCACKKYTHNQTNGILLINVDIKEGKEGEKLESKFFETDSFEVNCLCQINIDGIKTNYFLAGGLDNEKKEGMVKLYEVEYKNNEFIVRFLEDIVADDDLEKKENNKVFEGFKEAVNDIVQLKKKETIIVCCGDGQIYYFSKPNLSYYLEEDKEIDDFIENLKKDFNQT